MELFTINGEAFRVAVTALERSFTIVPAAEDWVAMDGTRHRSLLGTYYDYTMTVCSTADPGELERFWEAVSQPVESLSCTFPYGQDRLTQQMYVLSGSQKLLEWGQGNRWDAITVRFRGTQPRVAE